MLNYTKGNWECKVVKEYLQEPVVSIPIQTPKGQLLISANGIPDKGEMFSNALLISQAPAMYEALKRFLESSSCTNGCSSDDMTCDTMFARKIISIIERGK